MKWIALALGTLVAIPLGLLMAIVFMLSLASGGAAKGYIYQDTTAKCIIHSNACKAALGKPVNVGIINAPANIVKLDEAVAAAVPPMEPCSVPASLLLAQQNMESGFDPTAVSPTGALGLSQFETHAIFMEYALPVPPGGANPPTRTDPTDSAYAEARDLCGLGIITNPTLALRSYNCGSFGAMANPSCGAVYAAAILATAAKISATATSTTTTTTLPTLTSPTPGLGGKP